ncbi:cytidylate kinase [Blattabacterium sp. (Blattella germanica) str. Bge]|uniref:(d)CMP kinase n=1 Tax=Blattabacterium sp. (Blattella germanica) TaxID=624186 RepID=UPI0001BB62DB|nr:(d)CMP kinase [Blattabacterium sp. (Blattella germanica)]ACY40091.1 cytidylate kinase [Blattabacterium sp. (Blattella germanica) str. Bge]
MNQNHKIIIAIDGYSSSGKSTLAKKISNILKYKYIDTGAMYRGITLLAIRNRIFDSDLWNIRNFMPVLRDVHFKFIWNNKLNKTDIFLNEENIQSEIRSLKVTKKVSLIAQIPEIREKLTIIQKNFGEEKGIVMDGRDIGYSVFPKSELKIFMKGSIEVRSFRRYLDLQKKGEKVSYEEVKKNIIHRDILDTSRKISPLKKSIDSLEIDNTYLSIEDQLNLVFQLINRIKKNNQIII